MAETAEIIKMAKNARADEKKGGIGFLEIVLAALFVGFICAASLLFLFPYAQTFHATEHKQTAQIATVDADKLIAETIEGLGTQMRDGLITPDEMLERTKQFTVALLVLLEQQPFSDMIILKSGSVLVAPSHVPDLTQILRASLTERGVMPKKIKAR